MPKDYMGGTAGENVSSFINSFFPNYMASKERIRAKKDRERSRQKLSEIFGGQPLPEILKGMENVPLDQAQILAPIFASQYGGMFKKLTATTNQEKAAQTKQHQTISEILTQQQINQQIRAEKNKKAQAEAALKQQKDIEDKKHLAELQKIALAEHKTKLTQYENAKKRYTDAKDRGDWRSQEEARVEIEKLAKELALDSAKGGFFSNIEKIAQDFLHGGVNPSTNTIQGVGQNISSAIKNAIGGVKKLTPEKITIINKQGIRETRYFVGEQETDINGNPIR